MKLKLYLVVNFFLIATPFVFAQSSCFSVSDVMNLRKQLSESPVSFLQKQNRFGYSNKTSNAILSNFNSKSDLYAISKSTDFYGETRQAIGEEIKLLNKISDKVCLDKLYFQVPDRYLTPCDNQNTDYPLSMTFRKIKGVIQYEIDPGADTGKCIVKIPKTINPTKKEEFALYHFFYHKNGIAGEKNNHFSLDEMIIASGFV